MRNEIVLGKMIAYGEKITTYCKTETYDTFSKNTMLIEACVFNLSQIGELARKLTDDFTDSHTEIPWAQLRGLRNRIVHDYEGVNLTLVWDIIHDDLPDLILKLKQI